MREAEVEWISTEEAASILGLTMSGFYSAFKEERRVPDGQNTIRWRKEGEKYFLDKATVELYRARRSDRR